MRLFYEVELKTPIFWPPAGKYPTNEETDMSDSLSIHLDFRGQDSLLELLQMDAIKGHFTLARGEVHIEEKLSDEGSAVGLQVRVEYQNLLNHTAGRLVLPVQEEQLVQLARSILRRFAPSTEDLILAELQKLNREKNS